MTTDIRIEGGQVLVGNDLVETSIGVDGAAGTIASLGTSFAGSPQIDASGLLVLPGIVDIHGDAFERQMMPRPGVDFPIDVALLDTDRQVVANGITTVFHGVTWSWEPGLRGADNARGVLEGIERLRGALAADTRFHLRHETFNLAAEATIADWLAAGRIDLLAFNDHVTSTLEAVDRADKIAQMAKRSGLSAAQFAEMIAQVGRQADAVPASVARLAGIGGDAGIPLLSHDDASPAQRQCYRTLGCRLAEFPINIETAQAAASHGDDIVFGAPNIVRGGSHTGWTKAADMVERGLCSILASDYYYPAQALAAFRLVADGILALGPAWALIAEAPARAAGLHDRGQIAPGRRADLVLVDAEQALRPRIVATIANGRIVHLTDGRRLLAAPSRSSRRTAEAAA